MMRMFRAVALVEGVTTLALFFVAMPAKYWLGWPALVPPVGMTHGVAWIAYMAVMVVALGRVRAPWISWVRAIVAGLFPFGTFLNDHDLARLERREASVPR